MKDYEQRFETWKKTYEFEMAITEIDNLDCEWSCDRFNISEAFECELLALCRKYEFDPLKEPEWIGDNREDGEVLKAGKLGGFVGECLIEVIAANRRYRRNLPQRRGRRHGPRRMFSPRQAEMLLVGLKLLEDSREGLQLIRDLLETHDKQSDILVWKDRQIQSLQRVILSEGKRRVIKKLSGYEAAVLESLRDRTGKRVARLAELSARAELAAYRHPE